MPDIYTLVSPLQLSTLMEDDLAPLWYKLEIKSRKVKFSATATATKDLEKKKKAAAHTAEAEDEIWGNTIPTKR